MQTVAVARRQYIKSGMTIDVYKRQVQFVVNKDGSIVDAKVLRGVDPYLDKEAVRVIMGMRCV